MDILDRPIPAAHTTHMVENQPPPLADYDAFTSDAALAAAVAANGAGWASTSLEALGRRAAGSEAIGWGFEANANPPKLKAFDRFGHRVDEVEFHPSYHRLMEVAIDAGLHASAWSEPKPGAHVARAAAFYLWSQAMRGTGARSR